MLGSLFNKQLPSAKRRKLQTQLACAIAFLVLGFGNFFYGYLKYSNYQGILSKAKEELASPEKTPYLPILTPTVNIDKQTQYITKLKSRLEFYNFVILGGMCFLLASAVFFILVFLTLRPPPEDLESPIPP